MTIQIGVPLAAIATLLLEVMDKEPPLAHRAGLCGVLSLAGALFSRKRWRLGLSVPRCRLRWKHELFRRGALNLFVSHARTGKTLPTISLVYNIPCRIDSESMREGNRRAFRWPFRCISSPKEHLERRKLQRVLLLLASALTRKHKFNHARAVFAVGEPNGKNSQFHDFFVHYCVGCFLSDRNEGGATSSIHPSRGRRSPMGIPTMRHRTARR